MSLPHHVWWKHALHDLYVTQTDILQQNSTEQEPTDSEVFSPALRKYAAVTCNKLLHAAVLSVMLGHEMRQHTAEDTDAATILCIAICKPHLPFATGVLH